MKAGWINGWKLSYALRRERYTSGKKVEVKDHYNQVYTLYLNISHSGSRIIVRPGASGIRLATDCKAGGANCKAGLKKGEQCRFDPVLLV